MGVAAWTVLACNRSPDARAREPNAAPPSAASLASSVSIASSAEAVFAADRRRGIDFRALGQEPGWSLTIDEGHSIVFAANSMDDSVQLPAPALEVDTSSGIRTYRAQSAAHQLTVVRVPQLCRDPISDRVFDARVTVTFDGVTYEGCGKQP